MHVCFEPSQRVNEAIKQNLIQTYDHSCENGAACHTHRMLLQCVDIYFCFFTSPAFVTSDVQTRPGWKDVRCALKIPDDRPVARRDLRGNFSDRHFVRRFLWVYSSSSGGREVFFGTLIRKPLFPMINHRFLGVPKIPLAFRNSLFEIYSKFSAFE